MIGLRSKSAPSRPEHGAHRRDGGVEYRDVSIRYRGAAKTVTAVDGVTMTVPDGSFTSILGPSGCGKTSLLKATAGLLPESLVGEIRCGGEGSPARNEVGMVFQTAALLDWLSVRDNVAFPLTVSGGDKTAARAAAGRLLEEVNLGAFVDSKPYELSGGMQQRVSICRALIAEPSVLLMDEPFGHLDAITRDQMSLMTQRLWLQKPVTALLVTHSVAEAVLLSDQVVVMSAGPGSKVVATITIELPRPRTLALRAGADFQRYVREIEELLGVDQGEK